jgi:hypothetical protein
MVIQLNFPSSGSMQSLPDLTSTAPQYSDLRPGRGGDLGLGATGPSHTDHAGTLLKMDLVLGKDPNMRISEEADQLF